MNMSDVWRGTRHSDKAREIALVTRGVSDFCGTAAEDRAIRVSWDLTSGYGRSDSSRKIVELNGGLLNDIQAPFDGAFVDQLMGLSAHEAGHLMIAEVLGHKNSRNYADDLEAQVSNVVEDLAIDGRPMAVHNRTLGELTANVRIGPLRDAQREGMRAMWDSGNPLSAEGLLNLWGCARLFQSRDILKSTPQRAVLMATIAALDSEADKIQNADSPLLAVAHEMPKAVTAIRAILGGMPIEQPPAPKGPGKGKPEKGEGKAEGQATGGSPEKGDSGSGSSEEPEEEEAPEEPKGSEGDDSPGENDSEAEESDGDGGESGGEADGAGGDGAGKASNVYKPTKPMTCVNDAAKMAPTKAEKELFEAVAEELYALDLIDQLRNADRNADRVLAPYLDKRIVADVLRAYSEIASEPMRRKREEAGKLDRHRLQFAGKRADVFTSQADKVLDGTLVLLLDMSGSTQSVQTLIKQAGASVYAALRKTAIKPYVFTYGDTVVQLASPERVVDFDTVQSDGGTPTNIAFDKVLATVKPEGQSVIIHVTDGTPDQPVFAGQAMAKAQAAGWRVVNVLVGSFGITPQTKQYDQFNGGIYDPRSYGAPGFRRLNTYKELPKLIQAAVKAIVKGGKAC